MTREQALNYADDTTYGDWEGNALGVYELIDTIYDSFESQTCGNCAYSLDCYIKDSIFGSNNLPGPSTPYLGNFGCTQYKPKD